MGLTLRILLQPTEKVNAVNQMPTWKALEFDFRSQTEAKLRVFWQLIVF